MAKNRTLIYISSALMLSGCQAFMDGYHEGAREASARQEAAAAKRHREMVVTCSNYGYDQQRDSTAFAGCMERLDAGQRANASREQACRTIALGGMNTKQRTGAALAAAAAEQQKCMQGK